MRLDQRANSWITRRLPFKRARSQLTRPLASITFDDFPRSAWTAGGPILADYGARATYYASGRFLDAVEAGVEQHRRDDVALLLAAGHELGAHSYAHRMAPTQSNRELRADAAAVDRQLEGLGGGRMASYAYPYGAVSPRTKALMAGLYASARGITPGVNARSLDLAQLRANPLEHRRWVPREIEAAVEAAVARTGWVVFFTHDVDEAPTPFGATPAMLRFTLDRLAERGIEVLPVRQAMARAVFGGD